jgi:hypothetical protein
MTFRSIRTLAATGAALAALASAGVASAQGVRVYVAPPPPPRTVYVAPAPAYGPGYAPGYVVLDDGPRFRGGVNLGGGAIFVPGVINVGNVGIEGQLGVQINNQWAVYAAPVFDVIAGSVGGVAVGSSILAEFTLPGVPLSFGLGPTFGWLAAIGGVCDANSSTCTGATGVGGAYYGAKLRFEYHPVIVRTGIRRRALTLGLDVNILTGAFGASTDNTTAGTTVTTASVNDFGISPRIWIGYTSF